MKIKELREKSGFSQAQVSESLGIPRSTYSDWEREHTVPLVEYLNKLADFYHVGMDELFGREIVPVPLEVPSSKHPKIFHGNGIWHLTGKFEDIEQSIAEDLEDVKKTFFQIGYKLYLIRVNALYSALGYDNIVDYAYAKFGLGKSSTYNLIRVYERFYSFDNPL